MILYARNLFLSISISLIVFFPLNVNASNKKTNLIDGKVTVQHDDFYDKFIKNKSFEPSFTDFTSKSETPADVFDKLGNKANTKVSVTAVAKVPKQTVMRNLFANAKAGGKLVLRGGARFAGWVGLAYTLVDGYLVLREWVYDADRGNWVKPAQKGVFIIILTKTSTGWPSLENSTTYDDKALAKLCEGKEGCERMGTATSANLTQAQISACQTTEIVISGGPTGKQTVSPNAIAANDACAYRVGRIDNVNRYYAKAVRYSGKIELTQKDFNDIILPYADGNPSPYVDKSRPSENAPVPGLTVDDQVTVPNGTVVQFGPYTNPQTGKAEQSTATFQTVNNKTTVNISITARPDLKSNSSEAPTPGSQNSSQSDASNNPQSDNQSIPNVNIDTGKGTTPNLGDLNKNQSEKDKDKKTRF